MGCGYTNDQLWHLSAEALKVKVPLWHLDRYRFFPFLNTKSWHDASLWLSWSDHSGNWTIALRLSPMIYGVHCHHIHATGIPLCDGEWWNLWCLVIGPLPWIASACKAGVKKIIEVIFTKYFSTASAYGIKKQGFFPISNRIILPCQESTPTTNVLVRPYRSICLCVEGSLRPVNPCTITLDIFMTSTLMRRF